MIAGTIWIAVAAFIFVIILFVTFVGGNNEKKVNDSTTAIQDFNISSLSYPRQILSPTYIESMKRTNSFREQDYKISETIV